MKILKKNLPESLLNAPNVILAPVSLGNIFLSNRNTAPCNSHHSNIVDIVLIKVDFQLGVVSFWPLIESPALYDLRWLLKFEIFSGDVATKELELASLLSTLKNLGGGAGEGSNALRVGECLVEFGSRRTEFFSVGDSCGVN